MMFQKKVDRSFKKLHEEKVEKDGYLTEEEIEINVTLKEGEGKVTCWGCDLTYDYVKINGDYRT